MEQMQSALFPQAAAFIYRAADSISTARTPIDLQISFLLLPAGR